MLVFAHVPRTAGTSVAQWLRAAAAQRLTSGHANLYGQAVYRSEDDLRVAGLGDPRIQTVASHDIRFFPPQLLGNEAYYFTFLREPYARFGSQVRYMLLHRERFGVPRSLWRVEDVAHWMLDARFGELGVENEQTNFFALYAWCARHPGRDPAQYARWESAEHHAYWRDRVAIALEVLRSFLCVGLMSDVVGSLRVLRARAACHGIALPPPEEVPFVNETERTDDDERYLHEGPLADRIATSLRDDLRLYALVSAMLRDERRAEISRTA